MIYTFPVFYLYDRGEKDTHFMGLVNIHEKENTLDCEPMVNLISCSPPAISHRLAQNNGHFNV